MRRTSLDRELMKGRNEMKRSKKTKKKKGNAIKKFFIFNFILGTLCCYIGLFLLYGPISGFRDWLITTAMITMNHKYFATWFFDDETINECLNRNRIVEVNGITDEDEIHIIDYEQEEIPVTYANEYERQILERDKNNNDYKIIKINGGKKYSGYMAVIYDPSRVEVAASAYLGKSGQYLTDISKKNNALVAINAGGFVDENYEGTGGLPLGITVSKGRFLSSEVYSGRGGMIGINNQNKLILGKMNASQARSKGIRDGVTFGPFLMMNGEASTTYGNGGMGTAPRTAIAQRADGIILFLVLDGNRTLGQGATMNNLIEIFKNYGAVNAANLDGGTSTGMTVKGKLVNDPTNLKGSHSTRPVATAFILTSDGSDNGDYSVVKNKVDN